jgi:hypothetical protein
MCWFSAEYANEIKQAKAGQRLGIRTMHRHRNWVVEESELERPNPCPICLQDRTRVLFRFSEAPQELFQLPADAEAVFKMVKGSKRDIFEFAECRQIALDDLSTGQILDVLAVPGSEQLSDVLELGSTAHNNEDEREKESFFARLLAHL